MADQDGAPVAPFFPSLDLSVDPALAAEFWRIISLLSLKEFTPEWVLALSHESQLLLALLCLSVIAFVVALVVRYVFSQKELDIASVPSEVHTFFPDGEEENQSGSRTSTRRSLRLREPRRIVPPRDYEPEIVLFLYDRPSHIPVASASQFCLKLETFCRISGIPYKIAKKPYMEFSPKGRMPFAFLRDQYVGDTDFIIKAIQADPMHYGGVDVDSYLSDSEKALTQLFTEMFEGTVYNLCLYYLWIRDYHVTWRNLLPDLPYPIALIVARKIHQDALTKCSASGILDHTEAEIDARTVEKIEAISTMLGTNKYFVGHNATVVDCIAFAQLAIPLLLPYNNPLKLAISERVNLVEFVESMTEEYYPEYLERVVAINKGTITARKRARSRAPSQARNADVKSE